MQIQGPDLRSWCLLLGRTWSPALSVLLAQECSILRHWGLLGKGEGLKMGTTCPSGREVFSSAHKAKDSVDMPTTLLSKKPLLASLARTSVLLETHMQCRLTSSSELWDQRLILQKEKQHKHAVLWGIITAFLTEMSFPWEGQPRL